MRSLGWLFAIVCWLVGAGASHAGGISFPGEKCAFDHWPQSGWVVAPPAEANGRNRLLRASHDPRLGLAIEAWAGPGRVARDDAEFSAEELQRTALTERGWQVSRIDHAPVGGQQAIRARAHRRVAGQVFVLDEYQFDAAGRHFTLRVTGRGVGALQSPEVQRWLQSFRLL
ncbi:MAG: hypothetical protein GY723_14885 [bacterium]|nr:hypothetical protein [bacterium]MCP5069404.1 hypothetical protein [bacterium]